MDAGETVGVSAIPMPAGHRVRRSFVGAACGALLLVTACTNAATEPKPRDPYGRTDPGELSTAAKPEFQQSRTQQPIS